MNGLDIVIVVLLIVGGMYGYYQGFIRQIVGMAAWLIAAGCAFAWGGRLGEHLEGVGGIPIDAAPLVGFVVVSFSAVVLVKCIGALFHFIITRLPLLRVADSLLGAPVGAIGVAVMIGVAGLMVEWMPEDHWAQAAVQRSVLATRFSRVMQSAVTLPQLPSD